ncbi:MAG: trehalase family glycosidase [Candidatus Xenobia bacterium]
MIRQLSFVLFVGLLLVGRLVAAPPEDILTYIHQGWHTLTRSVENREAYRDPKVENQPALYLPADLPEPDGLRGLPVMRLPRSIHKLGDVQPSELPRQGLLYLPHPYVVPGGMFNEMYGWDSYFIMCGLVRDGEVALAQGMLENQLFEIEQYGAILNANRTYYLTRSQPPFLTSTVRMLYHAGQHDLLAHAYHDACLEHEWWTRAPNLAGTTGLSRYYDVGHGPVPEMRNDDNYYEQVAAWVLVHAEKADYVGTVGEPPQFDMQVSNPASLAVSDIHQLFLSADYYKGDRAMRASGFDVSFRFGPFSGATHHYAPVCLNSLLYKYETDLEWMAQTLGRPVEASHWQKAAAQRQALVNRYLWDAKAGMYFDYDVPHHTRSKYHYATTFYPLWAGLASPEQARAVEAHLKLFEQPHGLAMSDVESGAQWDKPFGWAPVTLLAVEGLDRYGFHADAARLARKFIDTVRSNYDQEHTIREKYDVVTGSATTNIRIGYHQNVVGFGWTNAAYLELQKYVR